MEFSAKVDANKLGIIKKRLNNLTPPLTSVERFIRDETEKQFATNSDPSGKPWSPLKESTLRTKKQNRDKILTRSGKLRSGFLYRVNGAKLEITNSQDYAIYHQYGTKKMAVRLIVAFTPERLREIKKIVSVYVKGRGR